MNKSDLINSVSARSALTKVDAEKAVNALLDTLVHAVQNGESVNLVGFGSWEVAHRAAHTGRNPSTGETIKIPAKNSVKFTAGKRLKDAVA